jgi:flagellin-like protein
MNFMKKVRKFRRETRAISPVIATLLMIAIAVVASLVTYAWVMGYMNFQTEKTGKAIQIQSMTNSAIYVQNVGDGGVYFGTTAVFVDGAAVGFNAPHNSDANQLAAGATETITLTTAITAGSHTVKVTTADGTFSQAEKTFP